MGLCGPPGPAWRWWHLPFVSLCMVGYQAFTSFPYSLLNSGGSWYVLLVVLMMLVIALPIMFVQVRLGGTTGRDVVSLLSKYIPGLQGVGAALLVIMFIMGLLGGVVLGYVLWYMFHAMASPGGQHYIWGRCDNAWNSKNCCPSSVICMDYLPSITYGSEINYPEEEYFEHVVLEREGQWNDLGPIVPHLVWPLFLTWLFIFALVAGGPRVFPWTVGGVGMLALLVVFMLLGYVYHSLAPEAARRGLHFIYDPDPSWLLYFEKYPRALVDSVASFTVLWFGLLPSYGKFCGRGTLMSSLAAMPIILVVVVVPNIVGICLAGYYGALSDKMHKSMDDVLQPGLMGFLVTLSRMTGRLELSPFWGSMLYVPLFFFGALFEALIALVITDSVLNGVYRGRLPYRVSKPAMRAILAAVFCAVSFLLSLPLVTKGGWYLFMEILPSLFAFELLFFIIYTLALLITYGRAKHLGILEKVIVMTVFFVISILAFCFIVSTDIDVIDALLVGSRGVIFSAKLTTARFWFRLAVSLGPLVLCLLIGLIQALCVAPTGCEKRLAYTCGGDRFDEVPVEVEEEGQEEVAIPLEAEPDMPDEKSPPFPDVDSENYEEPEIIPLYPSPTSEPKHSISAKV